MPDRSKTTAPCDCNALQYYVDAPDIPVSFDPSTGEYHLDYGPAEGRGSVILYHCFGCGGRLPESRRDQLFHPVTEPERRRLLRLIGTPATMDDATAALGPHSDIRPHGLTETQAETPEQPPQAISHPTASWNDLSPTVTVTLIDFGTGTLHPMLTGKPKPR